MKILIIGSGNLSWHLLKMFTGNAIDVSIASRNQEKAQALASLFSVPVVPFNEITVGSYTIVFLAVADQAIGQVVKQFHNTENLVVHCSGATDMNQLKVAKKHGVWYPLQTFTKESEIEYRTIPVCIEACDKDAENLLVKLTGALNMKHQVLSSQQRLGLHLAGVFACNFSNLMYSFADDLCQDYKLDFNQLHPLIEQTCLKIRSISPLQAQTGPAVRNDTVTMEKHMALLENHKELKQLYQHLSLLIHKKAAS